MRHVFRVDISIDFYESYYIEAENSKEAEVIAEKYFKPNYNLDFDYNSIEIKKLDDDKLSQFIKNSYSFDKNGNKNRAQTIGEILEENILLEKQKIFIEKNQVTLEF